MRSGRWESDREGILQDTDTQSHPELSSDTSIEHPTQSSRLGDLEEVHTDMQKTLSWVLSGSFAFQYSIKSKKHETSDSWSEEKERGKEGRQNRWSFSAQSCSVKTQKPHQPQSAPSSSGSSARPPQRKGGLVLGVPEIKPPAPPSSSNNPAGSSRKVRTRDGVGEPRDPGKDEENPPTSVLH